MEISMDISALKDLTKDDVIWKSIKAEGLSLSYSRLLPRSIADDIFKELEQSLVYFSGDLSKVKVFGREHNIPRQQVAYGDKGITYTFSGVTIPALPWPPLVQSLRIFIYDITGFQFDFVLVNRYRNGSDHIGEHRDYERDLDTTFPIASFTFGQARTFVLRHKDARKTGKDKRLIAPVKIELEHGSLLLMNPPTNEIWYHSLPVRKGANGVRINLTFRKYKYKLLECL